MYYIGVDLGGTGIKVGLVAEDGAIVAKGSVPTQAQAGYQVIVKDMADLIDAVLADAGKTLADCKAAGIGCPGSIDDKNGVVYYANNLLLRNAPLCEELEKYISIPCYLGNDANCAALGEYFALDDKEGVDSFIAVTLGTGVGGGIILNHKVYTGFNGIAGELGHIVLKMDGEHCTCGRNGCWEAYASATALIRDTERAAKENPGSLVARLVAENGGKGSGKTALEAARAGDAVGQTLVDNYVKYVSEGLIDLINIFQPHTIVIGGGISKEGDNLLGPIKAYIGQNTYGAGNVPATDIRIAKLGNDAGIIGAAFLGRA